ncbi:hypothetical protein CHS0354_006018 [Potamilus streckersoni]|uniref:Coronin n=1 Tax=Potamilus streckersoni TaxID=2493646 RepID=A0AAE0VN85_9BIVA|nr:hypothetical protein CHS0354_006018 [Potamilus streckersoni]
MAWRFKASKYKNAGPKSLKREDTIQDVAVGTLMQSCGNHITASCTYMAFNTDFGGGGTLGVLPLQTTGKIAQSLPQLKAHADFVTGLEFSPLEDGFLATCSADNTIKVWQLPENITLENITGIQATVSFPVQERRVEIVTWNPVANGILAAAVSNSVKVLNAETAKENIVLSDHGDQIQSISWRDNGVTLASICKDKKLRILDPRSCSVCQECEAHVTVRDSRVLCLGNKDQVLTTGFGVTRSREIKLWDPRNLKSSIASLTKDSSTSTLMPFFDADTNMLFLLGKGDSNIQYLEVNDKDPYFTENLISSVEQVKGAALVPKRALDVMVGEVNRLLLLLRNSITPIPYIVPRKDYKEFHEDLFLDTACGESALTADQWLAGENGQVQLMSLNPAKRKTKQNNVSRKPAVQQKGDNSITNQSNLKSPLSVPSVPKSVPVPKSVLEPKSVPEPKSDTEPKSVPNENEVLLRKAQSCLRNVGSGDNQKVLNIKDTSDKAGKTENSDLNNQVESVRASKFFSGVHQSKFKHLNLTTLHPSAHIVNIRNLSRTVPGESNMFCANTKRCALPIDGPGGLLLILDLNKPGRLPDTGLPWIHNSSKVSDFEWDPFDDKRLVVGCEDAKIRVWSVPEEGLTETQTEPDFCLRGHTEKIYFVKFHPLAKDVLLSTAYDMTVKIWDLTNGGSLKINIVCHPDQVFSADWSPDGKYLATVCKDRMIRVFEPRTSVQSLREGPGPEGSRGARILWVLNGQFLFVSGFSRSSVRMVMIYNAYVLSTCLHTVELDITPAILIPNYDEDSATVFLTGRGDSNIFTFEVHQEPPHLFQMSNCKPEGLHQALAFMPKKTCDVRKVEFARAWRLTSTSVEPVSFTVPRVKTEYFQDDLFPDTKVTWEPVLSSSDWFRGQNKLQRKISIRPPDMKLLSEAPVEASKVKKFESFNPETYKSDEQKKEELMNAMVNKLSLQEEPMPQDLADGVDSDEWEEY